MTAISGMLDTSFIVRYLTGTPEEAARRARDVIESGERLGIPDVGIAEAGYVLTSVYRMPREAVVDALVALVRRQNITTVGAEKEYVVIGLLMCRPSKRVAFADAMIWASARTHQIPLMYTFDEGFPSDGITLRSGAHST